MDPLSALFTKFPMSAHLFYAGDICNTASFTAQDGTGHLHILRGGSLSFTCASGEAVRLDEPAAVFFPKPRDHGLNPGTDGPTDILCATVRLGGGGASPFLNAFPDMLSVKLADSAPLGRALGLLVDEAFGQASGRQVAMDRLTEYALLVMLRHVVAHAGVHGGVHGGVLAGLAEPRIARVMMALHDDPMRAWTLSAMADVAAMSRARFAVLFRETTALTPLDYLTDWRISVAQSLLMKGRPLKIVAEEVGYSSGATFSRVFSARVGAPPMAWLKTHRA